MGKVYGRGGDRRCQSCRLGAADRAGPGPNLCRDRRSRLLRAVLRVWLRLSVRVRIWIPGRLLRLRRSPPLASSLVAAPISGTPGSAGGFWLSDERRDVRCGKETDEASL